MSEEETIQARARRLADVEIKKAGCHPHSPTAAVLHMQILRALVNPPMVTITPEAALEVATKSNRPEGRHHTLQTYFNPDAEEEL